MNLSCARVLMQHLSQSSQVHMPLPPKNIVNNNVEHDNS